MMITVHLEGKGMPEGYGYLSNISWSKLQMGRYKIHKYFVVI